MNYLDENLNALKIRNENLYNKVREYVDNTEIDYSNFSIIDTRDGNAIVVINRSGKEIRLNSIYNAEKEASHWVKQFDFSNIDTNVAMFGISNGIFTREILKQLDKNSVMLLVEPDIDLFLFCINEFDMTDIISDERIAFIIEKINWDKFINYLGAIVDSKRLNSFIFCCHPKIEQLYSMELKDIKNVIIEHINKLHLNYNTRVVLRSDAMENSIKNLHFLKNINFVDEFREVIPDNIPFIIVAAGPSLDKNIDELKRVEGRNFFHGLQSLQDAIVSETMRYYSEVQLLKGRIQESISDFNSQYGTMLISESDIDNYIEEVGKSFHISDDDIMKVLLQRRLNDEFGGQINNIFSESEGVIDLEIRKKRVQIMMRDNKISRMTDSFNLMTESAYIDDPFVLDNLGELGFMPLSEDSYNHRSHLISSLSPSARPAKKKDAVSELLMNQKLENIFEKLNEVCSGELVFEKTRRYVYRDTGTDQTLNIGNLSTGMKTFVIIKTLLQNGTLEKNGTIIPIGNWVLEQSIRTFSEWRNRYGVPFVLSVNISALQYQKEDFVETLLNIIHKYDVDPDEIELEITESILIDDFSAVTEKMQLLKEYGIRISLDDFGTGFSSLSYLKKLPINTLKIDKSFTDTLLTDSATRIITESIVSMVKSLGFESIAEGVEEEQQYKYLRAIGCDIIQGYLFGKPLSQEEIEQLLQKMY